jgi:hypothetical protein
LIFNAMVNLNETLKAICWKLHRCLPKDRYPNLWQMAVVCVSLLGSTLVDRLFCWWCWIIQHNETGLQMKMSLELFRPRSITPDLKQMASTITIVTLIEFMIFLINLYLNKILYFADKHCCKNN